MVFETVWRPSVSLSVRPAIHPPRAAAEGLLLSAVPEGDVDRQRRRRGAEQHWHRSTAHSSKREQCHVGGWRRKLDTDLSDCLNKALSTLVPRVATYTLAACCL